jgi:dihydrofolate reductase
MSGKVVVTEFISIDGVIQDPGGSGEYDRGGWSFDYNRGDEGDEFKLGELKAADAQLLGRLTYEGFAAAWPTIEDEQGFAEKMNSMPKYVVSTTITDPEWENTKVISANVPEEVKKLKDQYDGDILIAGSAKLIQTLVENDLVDEWRLMVFPLVLGKGLRLFADGIAKAPLALSESRTVGDEGVTVQVYRPKS